MRVVYAHASLSAVLKTRRPIARVQQGNAKNKNSIILCNIVTEKKCASGDLNAGLRAHCMHYRYTALQFCYNHDCDGTLYPVLQSP